MKNRRREFGKAAVFTALFITLAFVSVGTVSALAVPTTTVSGQVAIPDSDMGWKPDLCGMKVRVEGTDISADVDSSTGNFTLTGVPTGTITLLLVENNQDVFTQSSKKVQVTVGSESVTGVSFNLVYHWKEIGYPPHWGETGYGEWTPQFISDQVGFIMFRVRGEGIDPERMELYRTLDGGDTWEEILHLEDGGQYYWCTPFYFSDQNHGVAQISVDGDPDPDRTNYYTAGVLRTADGGATWSYVDLPNPPDENASDAIGIHRFAQINSNYWIATGQNEGTHSDGFPNFDVIWETTDSGATWEVKEWWKQDYGSCTGLGANSDGKAIAFFTPFTAGSSVERRVALRDTSGNWTMKWDDSIVTNSGYGPADVPMLGNTAWVTNYHGYGSYGSLPGGLYQSSDAGQNWTKISCETPQYMDFASLDKGFGLFGGSAHVTYDGGETWPYQSNGGGMCCGINQIWAFDTTHAIWHEGGDGDPNDRGQIFTYVEPREANFEVLAGVNINDGYVGSKTVNTPMGSYKFFNHGSVPIVVNALDLFAYGSGDDKNDVSAVKLWLDANANGYQDGSDTFIGSGIYSADNGSIHLSFTDILLKPQVPVHLLATYDFGDHLMIGNTYFCYVKAGDVQAKIQDTGTSLAPTAPSNYPIVTRQVTAGSVVFSDDFESGLDKWAADNITGDCISVPWSLTDEMYISPSHSAYIWGNRSTCNYGRKNNLTLKEPIDLSSNGEHYLTFWHKVWMEPVIELKVEASTDDGVSWETLKTYENINNSPYPVYEVLDLSEHCCGYHTLIRFQLDWTSWWYYNVKWYIDNVQDISIPNQRIYVPDDYATIQSAVDNASAGSTVIVRDGAYTENINVDKHLAIESENGSAKTIVQAANPSYPVFKVTANCVKISGFTIENATGDAGIYLEDAKHCDIFNNSISNNDCGIYLCYPSSNNLIYHNNLLSNTLNAYDSCTNQWNITTTGNYWSDYTGNDANHDGIGGESYPIPGGVNIDHHPLMQPWGGDTPQKGDLNSDSILTPADAAIALEIAAGGSASCDATTLAAADVSGDGQVTSLDALMILQAAAGKIEL